MLTYKRGFPIPITTQVESFKKYGDEAKIKLRVISVAEDPNIYLRSLIDSLFKSYTISTNNDDPKFHLNWDNRIDLVIGILIGNHILYKDLYAEPDPYKSMVYKKQLQEKKIAAQISLTNMNQRKMEAGIQLRNKAVKILRNFD